MGTRYAVQIRYVSGPPHSLTSHGLWTRLTTEHREHAEKLAHELNAPGGYVQLQKSLNEDPFTDGTEHRVLEVFVQPFSETRDAIFVLHTRNGIVQENATITGAEVPATVYRETTGAPGVTLREEYALRKNQRDLTLDSYHFDLTR